jgi:hypothetical protein
LELLDRCPHRDARTDILGIEQAERIEQTHE